MTSNVISVSGNGASKYNESCEYLHLHKIHCQTWLTISFKKKSKTKQKKTMFNAKNTISFDFIIVTLVNYSILAETLLC